MTLWSRYIQWRLRPHAKLVYQAMESGGWELSEHTIKHTKSGLRFWIGSGASKFTLYMPEIDCFNSFEKRVLYKKHKEMIVMTMFTKMAGLE